MKIMTGKTGAPHVTSQQFRQLVEGAVGQGSYILQSGENLEPELQTNNLLKIRSGMMSHHGNLSVVDIGTYDEVTIANGTQGMQRIDLVVNRYTRNESSGIEANAWIVIQGAPAASNPQVPAYTEGNLQEGDLVDDCPVFEVHLNGINVTEVVKLLEVSPDIPTLNASLSELIGNSMYNPGDSASIKNLLACGCVTTGNKDLLFYIPVSKRLSNVSSVKIVGAKGSIRQNGTYLMGGTSEDHTFGQNQWTVSIMPDLQALACRYTFSGTLDGTNNDSMTIEFSAGKIEFS